MAFRTVIPEASSLHNDKDVFYLRNLSNFTAVYLTKRTKSIGAQSMHSLQYVDTKCLTQLAQIAGNMLEIDDLIRVPER